MASKTPTQFLKSGYTGSIAYNNRNVNITDKPFNNVVKFSRTVDSDGNQLSAEQEKYFADWSATLNVATNTNGEKILYDIDPIKK